MYKTFLKYLYTNEIDPFLDPLNALGKYFYFLLKKKIYIILNNIFYELYSFFIELLDLANAYSENQLKRYCIQIINKGITITNVIVLYNTSIQYNAKVNNIFFYIILHKISLNYLICHIFLGIRRILF